MAALVDAQILVSMIICAGLHVAQERVVATYCLGQVSGHNVHGGLLSFKRHHFFLSLPAMASSNIGIGAMFFIMERSMQKPSHFSIGSTKITSHSQIDYAFLRNLLMKIIQFVR